MEKISQIIPSNPRNSPAGVIDERSIRAGAPDFMNARGAADPFAADTTQFSSRGQEQAEKLRLQAEGIDRLTKNFFTREPAVRPSVPPQVDIEQPTERVPQNIPNSFVRVA
jgi:hypothetical protein